MPYDIKKSKGGYFVHNKNTGKKYSKSPHKTLKAAKKQLAALHINVEESFDDVCNSILTELVNSATSVTTTTPYKNSPSSLPPSRQDVDLDNPEHQLAAWELTGNKKEDWAKLSPLEKKKFVDTAKQNLQKSNNSGTSTSTQTIPPTNQSSVSLTPTV